MIQQGPPSAEHRPKTREDRIAAILKRIEYAKDCIEYDHNKDAAIQFLQELHRSLSQQHILRNDTQMLIEKCYACITDYGILPLEPKEQE